MTKPNYIIRVRASNAGCLMSTVCTFCYREGKREAYFGAKPNGGVIMGGRDIDIDFQKRIWQAAQKHLKGVHGKKIFKNRMGGWYVATLDKQEND